MKTEGTKKIHWDSEDIQKAAELAADFQVMMQRLDDKGNPRLLTSFDWIMAFVSAILPLFLLFSVTLLVSKFDFTQGQKHNLAVDTVVNSQEGETVSDQLPYLLSQRIKCCGVPSILANPAFNVFSGGLEVIDMIKAMRVLLQKILNDSSTLTEHRVFTLNKLIECCDVSTISPNAALKFYIDRQEGIERIKAAQAAELEVQKAKAEARKQSQHIVQNTQYRTVVSFISLLAAYAIFTLFVLYAQTMVASRCWVTRETKMDKEWTVRNARISKPTICVIGFCFVMILVLYIFDVVKLFPLPDSFQKFQYPVPPVWIFVGAFASSVIFSTALAIFLLAGDFPSPVEAHALKVKMRTARLAMKKPERGQVRDSTEEVSYLEVLALGCTEEALKKSSKLSDQPAKFPRVSRTARPEANWDAIKTLCILLIALMVVTLILVSLGFDVLEGRLDSQESEAARASGNAWIMSLGTGMSISVFLIYGIAASRLLPYCVQSGLNGGSSAKGWSLTGKIRKPFLKASVQVKPDDEKKHPKTIDRKQVFMLGGDDTKLKAIITGCQNGGGIHASLNKDLFVRLANLLALLAPAATGTALSLLK